MSTKQKRERDRAQAQYMKQKGITRKYCNCPICHNRVALNRIEDHIRTCG